uniref:Reverse transcriptase domain-containing protein n=1 Tax=Plectus sambesii TaxID=2011161 RepID=A0A914WG72_9BILA
MLGLAANSIVSFASSEVAIDVQRGFWQGDTLSPKLFFLYLQHALDSIDWVERGLKVSKQRLLYLTYADDIVLLAHDVNELQSMADDFFTACAAIGLNMTSPRPNGCLQKMHTTNSTLAARLLNT